MIRELLAGVAELADAPDSKSGGRKAYSIHASVRTATLVVRIEHKESGQASNRKAANTSRERLTAKKKKNYRLQNKDSL